MSITNRQFRNFVNKADYATFAELTPDLKVYPRAPHMLEAGSAVLTP